MPRRELVRPPAGAVGCSARARGVRVRGRTILPKREIARVHFADLKLGELVPSEEAKAGTRTGARRCPRSLMYAVQKESPAISQFCGAILLHNCLTARVHNGLHHHFGYYG